MESEGGGEERRSVSVYTDKLILLVLLLIPLRVLLEVKSLEV